MKPAPRTNKKKTQDLRERVRAYWELPTTVSIIDKNLHLLEIDAVSRHLLPTDRVADIGCGNGEATVRYASLVRECIGFERSATMRERARKSARKAGASNLRFVAGDLLKLDLRQEFDVVISQRLLINLVSWEDQCKGLEIIRRMLKPGGRAILVENTNDGAQELNLWRSRVGLPPIPQHWHNRFFDREAFMDFLQGRFQLLKHYDFGLYYLLTRVYTQMFASFQGWGPTAVKDPIFEKTDHAARILLETFGDRIRIEGCPSLGPIQVFVLRREQ